MPDKTVTIDLGISRWKLREQMTYRDAVGVNPQYALLEIIERIGARDEDGQMLNEAYNVPPEYLVGLVWITQRRQRPDLTFDEAIDEVGTYDDLLEGFRVAWGALVEEAVKAEARRPTKAGGSGDNPARTTPSSAATAK